MTPEDQLIDDIAGFSRDPLGYVKYAFDWGSGELEEHPGPHEWQADVLSLIGTHLQGDSWDTPLRIAVASGRGIGKSALIAMITHWAKDTCDDCRVVVTANTEDQLATKTWPEILKWCRRSITSSWWVQAATKICSADKRHADTWRVDRQTWSENNVEAFRGLHNIGKRMIFIFDEAAGIPTPIWQATEGTMTDEKTEMIWIAFSNPSQNSGSFAECFGRLRHRWVHFQIDSRNVPGTNLEEIRRWIEDYGEDSDYVRVNVRGEFPRAGSKQFIAGDVVQEARHRDVGDQSRAYEIMSVDVARFGSNQTVIGSRRGLHAEILDKMRGENTIIVAQRVIERILQRKPRTCVIDGDGIGGGVADYVRTYLAERWAFGKNNRGEWVLPEWFRLEEFHGGAAPGDAFMYFNLRAEVWGKMRDWLVTGSIPDDPELAADLVGPEYGYSNKNQIQLERKEDMDKRGLASPDSGDMLAMTFGVSPIPKTREEALLEQIQATADPLERHFMRLKETERRKKAASPMSYWE